MRLLLSGNRPTGLSCGVPASIDPDLHPISLGIVGQLRECMAAARNLEHLVASRTVGPQVLAQVIPDVATALCGLREVFARAKECVVHSGIALSDDELTAFSGAAIKQVSRLLDLMRTLSEAPVHAKTRLELERRLGKTMPVLVTAVAHFELLLEVTQVAAAEMNVHDLLTSIPDRGSERPYRPILVDGQGLDSVVTIPPRIALKSLSAWVAGRVEIGSTDLGLVVRAGDKQVRFSVGKVTQASIVVLLPVFFAAPHTSRVVRVVLQSYGGDIVGEELILPVFGHDPP